MQISGTNPGPCPRCDGELELKVTIGHVGQKLETRFFQCKNCDHIHAVECKSPPPIGK